MDPIDAVLSALTGGAIGFTPVAGGFVLIGGALMGWLMWARIVRSPFLRPRPTRHAPRVDAVARVHSALDTPRLSDVARLWQEHLADTLLRTTGRTWHHLGWLYLGDSGLDPTVARELRALGRSLLQVHHALVRDEAERDVMIIDTGRAGPPDPRLTARLGRLTLRTARAVARLEQAPPLVPLPGYPRPNAASPVRSSAAIGT
ncbi:MAG: hypothetical protein L3K15_08610 [Thermoplasmata archaeon]|nr:hypothetical protein [Thermoplasmata archaeon]